MNEELISAEEMVESLTGFDEIAIEKAFGTDFYELKNVKTVRALVFVGLRREGMKDAEAYKAVQELTVAALNDRFADDEPNPEEPITEPGKDSGPHG